MAQGRLTPSRRRLALGALVLGVALMHAGVGEVLLQHTLDLRPQGPQVARMAVSYVRELSIEAPPARGVTPPPTPRPARAVAPPPVASAPSADEPEASPDEGVSEPPAVEPPDADAEADVPEVALNDTTPEAPPDATPPAEPANAADGAADSAADSAAPAVAQEDAVPADAAPLGPRFDWPVSTRVSYVLSGNYQGEIHGSGQVEWIRVGDRYQVHVDVVVGLSFAPLMSRRMSSEGLITPQGLQPQRYEQVTKQAFSPERAARMRFEPEAVTLANGTRLPPWPGVQDTASQFVQMVWWFGTQPERLRPGQRLEVPLALPRHVSLWAYDVGEEETLYTPFGAVQAIPVNPQRPARRGGDLVPQMWFAPSLRYLPVRIRIHQDADTFVDLVIARKPELAAP